MKYTGLCEKYGAGAVAVAAVAIPVAGALGLSAAFNMNADYYNAMLAGMWGYLGTHFLGKEAAHWYLKDKGAEMGPTRASAITRKIQTAMYAVIVAGISMTGFMTEDTNETDTGLLTGDDPGVVQIDQDPLSVPVAIKITSPNIT